MFAANFQQQLNQINVQQNQIAQAQAAIPANVNALAGQVQRGQRQINALYDAFMSFWGNRTLSQNDQRSLSHIYGLVMVSLAYEVDGHNAGATLSTHCRNYQCILLPGRPIANAALNVGYYLYQTQQAGVTQTYALIIHPNPIASESVNLNALAPPAKIMRLLNSLPWPGAHAAANPVILDTDLIQWIASQSQRNKTTLLSNDIFLTDETSNEFTGYLSTEARKPQKIQGIEYRSLVKENGFWASTGAFFGNAAGAVRDWWQSNQPKTYGYDTVINQTTRERENEGRFNEIALIVPTIANRYIQNHIGLIDAAVRDNCQNGMRSI